MSGERLISSDSHVIEPPDLWEERMSRARYGDRIPRVVREGGNDFWHVDGVKLMSAARTGSQVGVRFKNNLELRENAAFEEVLPGAYMPEARLKDNASDGIYGEIIYPTVATNLYRLPDPRLIADAFKAYNDWIADFCIACSPTVKAVGTIILDDVDVGVAELQRARKKGLVGALVPVSPREECPYSHRMYDEFWAAAQDLNMPVSMHLRSERVRLESQMHPDRYKLIAQATDYLTYANRFQVSIANMIFSGVFERYPELKVVSVEFDASWVEGFLKQMDYLYTQRLHHDNFFSRFKSKDVLPSDYFRRNVFVSFQEDMPAIEDGAAIGIENFMWGSDYPHQESTFPHSRDTVSKVFGKLSRASQQKVTFGNAAEMYGIA